MQVELERVGPSGRRARLSTMLGILGPLAALGIVVAAAAGPGVLSPGKGLPSPSDFASPRASANGQSTESRPAPTGSGELGLPRYAYNLTVRSVGELLADRRSGTMKGGLVAVAGLLAQDPGTAGCGGSDQGLTAIFCDRTGRLDAIPTDAGATASGPVASAGSPGASATSGSGSMPHLHPRILPGTPMPELFRFDPRSPDAGVGAVPAIVIGRFASAQPADCPGGGGRCRDEFILERLAWAAGNWFDRTLVRDPGLPEAVIPSIGPRPQAIASRETDRMEQILTLAVFQPGWLAEIDPVAARAAAAGRAAIDAGQGADGPVWYLRSVSRPMPDRERHLTWAVMDHATGRILATGTVGQD